jgi:hypothetical protein
MKTKWGSLRNNEIGGYCFENTNTKQGSCLGVHILIEGMISVIIIHAMYFQWEKKMWSVHLTGLF